MCMIIVKVKPELSIRIIKDFKSDVWLLIVNDHIVELTAD